jgi:hypothetical protein
VQSEAQSPHGDELESIVIINDYDFVDADIWFVRFALDPTLRFLAVGTKVCVVVRRVFGYYR